LNEQKSLQRQERKRGKMQEGEMGREERKIIDGRKIMEMEEGGGNESKK
jgi:hypothetical protein